MSTGPQQEVEDAVVPFTPQRRSLRGEALAVGSMILGILAVYCPLALLGGRQSLLGIDYNNIHERRIRYAQEAFSAESGGLPGWYTRELMGTPFWSNVQSFPFLPTRLAVVWIDPAILFPVAVNLAAVLAALFTYLYLRKMQLGRVASAAGGWTFAASGFFASRILAGHLPLLEAFGALPLLLWCLESIARADVADGKLWRKHLGLAVASLCVVLCGHPQVPAYAMGAAILYAIVRMWGRAAVRTLLTMGFGIGLGGFVWWPMLKLIGRSSRVLSLDSPDNDLALPYWRLKAFLFPWADGWPKQVIRLPAQSFVDYPSAYFWDTVSYVGWAPLLAALVLAVRAIARRRLPAKPWLFLALMAVGAVVLALPFAQALTSQFRVTLLRSPSRLLYLATFSLAAALAVGVDELLRPGPRRKATLLAGLAVLLLAVHAIDLGVHARSFLHFVDRVPAKTREVERWRRNLGPQRFAFDCDLIAPANRAVDDVGFFDSIMLARPYRAILALNGSPAGVNTQGLNGSSLPARALAGLCARFVITNRKRDDLELIEVQPIASTYGVPEALPRAMFVPDASVRFLEDDGVLELFRNGTIDFGNRMYLAPATRPDGFRDDPTPHTAPEATLAYERPDSDHVAIRIEAPAPGYVRLMESWDVGWSATLDGRPAELIVADTFAMAVRLEPGSHEVRWSYRTAGTRAGWAITAVSAALLALLVLRLRP